jgi:hypothetical protein
MTMKNEHRQRQTTATTNTQTTANTGVLHCVQDDDGKQTAAIANTTTTATTANTTATATTGRPVRSSLRGGMTTSGGRSKVGGDAQSEGRDAWGKTDFFCWIAACSGH